MKLTLYEHLFEMNRGFDQVVRCLKSLEKYRALKPDEIRRVLRHLRHRRAQEATEQQRVDRLTPRETEILQLMARGLPTEEIATELGVSPYTLRTHVQNILTKLGVHSKLEALAFAIRLGKVTARQ